MGMSSAEGAGETSARGTSEPGAPLLLLAAAALGAEALGLCAAIVLNIIDSASGRGSTFSDAVGFIVLEAVIAGGLAAIALGLARVRPWSRTPAVMLQVFTLLIAVWLIQAHDYGWGVPALLLGLAGLAGVFAPASLRALTRVDH
jgi:hypothetical protein